MIESLTSYDHTYINEQISLADVARPQKEAGDRRVTKTRFVGCEILGPAVVVPGDGFLISGVAYLDGDWQESFRALAPAAPYPAGAISVNDCEFQNCSFQGVQFMAPVPFIWQIRRHFHPYNPN